MATLVDPLALDDKDRIESFGISFEAFKQCLDTILDRAVLIASDEEDVFDPKRLYKFGANYLLIEGGGMSSEVVEFITLENAFKKFEILRADKNVVVEIVKSTPYLVEFISDELKADKNIISVAVQKNGYALKFASLDLKNDPEIALVAASNPYFSGFEFVSSSLKDNKEFVLKVVGQNKSNLKFASDRLRDDFDVALAAVRPNRDALKFLSKKLISDDYVRYVAFSKPDAILLDLNVKPSKQDILDNPAALIISDVNFREDRDFILELVKIDGHVLMFAPDRLKDDDYVVFTAERQRPGAYIFASERLKSRYEKGLSYNESNEFQLVSLMLNWKKLDQDSDFWNSEFSKRDFIRLDGAFWLSIGNGFNGDLSLYITPKNYDIEDAWEGNRSAGESDLWAYAKIFCCPKNISIGQDIENYLAIIAIKSNTFFDRQNEILHIIDLEIESPDLNNFVRTYDADLYEYSLSDVWAKFFAILEKKFDAVELPPTLN